VGVAIAGAASWMPTGGVGGAGAAGGAGTIEAGSAVGAGDGSAVGVGVGDGSAVGVGVGMGDGSAVGVGVGNGSALGVGAPASAPERSCAGAVEVTAARHSEIATSPARTRRGSGRRPSRWFIEPAGKAPASRGPFRIREFALDQAANRSRLCSARDPPPRHLQRWSTTCAAARR
jgi:hypothetical protein